MNERRLVVALFGVVVAVVVGLVAVQFVEALTISVFLYYSTRRFHKALRRLRLTARIRAATTMASLVVPLFLLISYTVVILVIEARQLITQYPVTDIAARNLGWFGGIDTVPEFTVTGLYTAYRNGELDPFVTFLTDNAPFLANQVSNFFLNLFIVTVVVYYLLVDGNRIREWLLRFDDETIVREYLEAVDRELESVLFGNMLNVIVTSLIAIAVYSGYNSYVPVGAQVPYPALAGALTGVASLIPVVGMKIVYVPLTGAAAASVAMGGDTSLLAYVGGFFVLVFVVVDTVPDLVLRPIFSGETTHVGLLMLAYTLGPVVLGFYGFFFAPILLVIGLTFANTALPRLLGVDPDEQEGLHRDQLRLEDF
ncbi:MAG: AI-2E family transporter [Haloarculaceae archaeon]